MNFSERTAAIKVWRKVWWTAVNDAFDCEHIGHGEMLLAFHEIDKWYSAELHAIDLEYEAQEGK